MCLFEAKQWVAKSSACAGYLKIVILSDEKGRQKCYAWGEFSRFFGYIDVDDIVATTTCRRHSRLGVLVWR